MIVATALCAALIVTKSMFVLCLAISFAFAVVYSGMRGIYFAALAGSWLDTFGLAGYDYIWIYTVACGVAGIVVAFITYRYSKKLEARNKAADEQVA